METGAITIGRSSENDLVLPDPTGAISRQHCRIEHAEGSYRLTDTSTNGVFVNASGEKVGRGNSVVLADGDQLSIGHYQLEVQVAGGQAAGPEDHAADPFQDLVGEDVVGGVEDDLVGPADALTPDQEDEDLLGLLPGQALPDEDLRPRDPVVWDLDAPEPTDDAKEATFSGFQQIGCEQVALDPFETAPQDQIPADWDEQPAAEPLAAEPLAAATARPARSEDPFFGGQGPGSIQAEAGGAPAQHGAGPGTAAAPLDPPDAPPAEDRRGAARSGSAASGHGDSEAFKAFLAGAGLEDAADLQNADPVETMRLLGEIYSDVVVGLRGLLEARRVIKSELKMSQTIIQQSGNNPLKWSLSDEEAVESLLGQSQRGRLPPREAIQEAFEDLNTHQIAMVVGMERAIAVLLKRFDPKALEAKIESANKVSKLIPGLKSRYWEEFTRLYAEIAQEAEEDFDNLFGREFAKAYEERVHQITGKASASPFRGPGRGLNREK